LFEEVPMKFGIYSLCWPALLVLAVPLLAGTPATAGAGQSVQPVLKKLVGKPEIIGLTLRGGSRFLGRVISGDHDLYLVQTFHYESAPAKTAVATPQTTVVTGRNRRMSYKTKWVTKQVTTHTVIPDDVAVKALLSGVAGASYRPHEQKGARELVAPADVLCVQSLSPPAKPVVLSPSLAAAQPASAPASPGWTLKTLWASPDLPATKAAAPTPPSPQ
jgi:hypothetical protein